MRKPLIKLCYAISSGFLSLKWGWFELPHCLFHIKFWLVISTTPFINQSGNPGNQTPCPSFSSTNSAAGSVVTTRPLFSTPRGPLLTTKSKNRDPIGRGPQSLLSPSLPVSPSHSIPRTWNSLKIESDHCVMLRCNLYTRVMGLSCWRVMITLVSSPLYLNYCHCYHQCETPWWHRNSSGGR